MSFFGGTESMNTSIASDLSTIAYILFYSPYWYVPVYFITLIVILIFNRYMNKIWFGAILMLITAFYTFSFRSQIKDHTTAFFAFVFYVWLGMFINEKNLIEKIRKWRVDVLIILIVIALILASFQSYLLLVNHDLFYFNNLRFFNQVYGVLFFCLLIRICPQNPTFLSLIPGRKRMVFIFIMYFLSCF